MKIGRTHRVRRAQSKPLRPISIGLSFMLQIPSTRVEPCHQLGDRPLLRGAEGLLDPCFMALDRSPSLAKEAPAAGGEAQGNLPGVARPWARTWRSSPRSARTPTMADMVARLTPRCRARSTWMMPGQPSTSQRMAICFWVSFRPGKLGVEVRLDRRVGEADVEADQLLELGQRPGLVGMGGRSEVRFSHSRPAPCRRHNGLPPPRSTGRQGSASAR